MKLLPRLFAFGAISFYLLAPSAIVFAATPLPPKPTCQLSLNTSSINVGGTVTLKWTSTNATAGAITYVGNVGPTGLANLLPPAIAKVTYVGSFTGPGGTANCSATVSVSFGTGGSGGVGGTSDATLGSSDAGAPASIPTPIPLTANPTNSQSGLIPCGYGTFDPSNSTGSATGCQACDLATLVQTLINFMIGLSIPIAAALFAWAGVLFFTAVDDHHKIDQAKAIFKNAFIGFVIVITAWLVINTLLHALLDRGKVFSGSSWFSVSCTAPDKRPVNASIGAIISQILGSASSNNNSINAGGSQSIGTIADNSFSTSGGGGGDYVNPNLDDVGAFNDNPTAGPGGSCAEGYSYGQDGNDASSGSCFSESGDVANPIPYGSKNAAIDDTGAFVDNPTAGPGGSCPTGYTYGQDGTDASTGSCFNENGDVVNPSGYSSAGSTGPHGVAQCNEANTNCNISGLAAQGLTQAQANAMSCIAMTENAGQAVGCSGTGPCGTFQISKTNWKQYAPDGCSAANFNGNIIAAQNNAQCNLQTAAIMVQAQGYQPWTGNNNGVYWNTNARKCVANYDPSNLR